MSMPCVFHVSVDHDGHADARGEISGSVSFPVPFKHTTRDIGSRSRSQQSSAQHMLVGGVSDLFNPRFGDAMMIIRRTPNTCESKLHEVVTEPRRLKSRGFLCFNVTLLCAE